MGSVLDTCRSVSRLLALGALGADLRFIENAAFAGGMDNCSRSYWSRVDSLAFTCFQPARVAKADAVLEPTVHLPAMFTDL